MSNRKALLLDFTQCIGCGACEKACAEQNELSSNPPDDRLSSENYTVVLKKNGQYYRKMCMHCEEPACVSVCPVAALEKKENGAVIYHADRCIGCRYCMVACPFQIPKYEWDRAVTPVVRKCILCFDRIKNGLETACAWVCPTGACRFGDREKLLAIARRRIAAFPDRYVEYIYGEFDVGGTDVLMLSGVAFEELGFRKDLGKQSLPQLTWTIMSKIPNIVITGTLLLGGVSWIIHRRMDIELDHIRQLDEERRTSKGDNEPEGGAS